MITNGDTASLAHKRVRGVVTDITMRTQKLMDDDNHSIRIIGNSRNSEPVNRYSSAS